MPAWCRQCRSRFPPCLDAPLIRGDSVDGLCLWVIRQVWDYELTLCLGLIIRASLSRNHELTGEGGMDSAWSRRLMAIGVVSTIYGLIPTSVAIALLATTSPVTPWPGWKAIHSTIDVIVYVPARQWQSSTIWIASAELRRWAIVTLAFVVFMFLGLTADMKKVYRAPFRSFNDSSSQIGCGLVVFCLPFCAHHGLQN